jgi:tetratricopeptide (TPR) repeat protein
MRSLMMVLLLAGLAQAGKASELSASTDATFRRGNDAYFHGRYREAVEAYEQVVALGVVSEDVYYNLGNGYLKSGQVGPAIYNYERALELDPNQESVIFNLKVARDVARKKGEDRLVGAEASPMWVRAVQPFAVGTVSWLFASLYLGLFALLIARHFIPPGFVRVGLTAVTVFVALATLGSGLLLGGRLYLADRVEQAIVLPDSIAVKEGPDPNYSTLFSVHAGLKVRISEREQDWVRVHLANGLEGWVLERDLGRL